MRREPAGEGHEPKDGSDHEDEYLDRASNGGDPGDREAGYMLEIVCRSRTGHRSADGAGQTPGAEHEQRFDEEDQP